MPENVCVKQPDLLENLAEEPLCEVQILLFKSTTGFESLAPLIIVPQCEGPTTAENNRF